MSASLEYQDINGNAIRVHLRTFGIIVGEPSFPAMGAADIGVAALPSSELVVESELLLPNQMTVPFTIPANSAQEAGTRRARLIKLLRQPGAHKLFFDFHEPGKYYRVKMTGASAMENFGYGWQFEATFAVAPFLIGETPTELSYALTTSPETIYANASGTPADGIAAAHPKITIENTSGAAITDRITILNVTTNEQVSWQGTFADGEFLRFDCTNRERVDKAASLVDLELPASNADSGITAGSVFPTLDGEEINELTITNAADCAVTIWYEPEY